MAEKPDADKLNAMNADIVEEFRANEGKVGGPFEDADMLLLTTTGAKSGERRLSPLVYLSIDDKMIVVGSFAGADVDPAWVHNVRANPRAHVELGTTEYDVFAYEIPLAQRDELYEKVSEAASGFADYQANTSRVIPLFELVRA